MILDQDDALRLKNVTNAFQLVITYTPLQKSSKFPLLVLLAFDTDKFQNLYAEKLPKVVFS